MHFVKGDALAEGAPNQPAYLKVASEEEEEEKGSFDFLGRRGSREHLGCPVREYLFVLVRN